MDIDKLDRRMPYRVPDAFFDDLEDRIMAQTATPPATAKKKSLRRWLIPTGIAAAVAAIMLTVNIAPASLDDSESYLDIALAFDNLSNDERTCLIDAFQDDIFFNQ